MISYTDVNKGSADTKKGSAKSHDKKGKRASLTLCSSSKSDLAQLIGKTIVKDLEKQIKRNSTRNQQ